MTTAKNAASEQHTSLTQLLAAVEVAHKLEDASPGRRGTRHTTSLVAHDHVLAQSRSKHQRKTVSFSDKPRRESLWSRASTLPGAGFRLTNRSDDAATSETENVTASSSSSPPRASARSVHRDATVAAIALPSVSLPFLHSNTAAGRGTYPARTAGGHSHSASPTPATPEGCKASPSRHDWESPSSPYLSSQDDLFCGSIQDRSIEDLASMVAWLDE